MQVFYSYSHQDEALRRQLEIQLAMVRRNQLITDWHDREIVAGTEWDAEIKRNLNAADIILLLVSPDFLASEYIWEVELKPAIKRHEAGEARVIPIILRPCDWKHSSLGQLQALPKGAKPITQWPDRDEAFLTVVDGIRDVLKTLESRNSSSFSSDRVIGRSPIEPPKPSLQLQRFSVVTVNAKGETISTKTKQAQYFSENLPNGVLLPLVEIPGGTFWMGTDDVEIERLCKKFNWDGFKREKPQHFVTVSPFLMGKYTVTQKQWREIANLPKIDRDLDPDPSYFKGDNRPVEQVSWYDAVEFCERLCQKTGNKYRLPSEAEWEYACRAGTTTPFYLGETITGDLANYDATYVYANELKGKYRQETISVGEFLPNTFGLYDMYGNVWEWCADTCHENYDGAPTDGRAWSDENDNRSQTAVLRGGSWFDYPQFCRSAYRSDFDGRDNFNNCIGFRVVCGGFGRT